MIGEILPQLTERIFISTSHPSQGDLDVYGGIVKYPEGRANIVKVLLTDGGHTDQRPYGLNGDLEGQVCINIMTHGILHLTLSFTNFISHSGLLDNHILSI